MARDIGWVIKFLKKLLEDNPNFTGKIEINFFQGGVTNINKSESIKHS